MIRILVRQRWWPLDASAASLQLDPSMHLLLVTIISDSIFWRQRFFYDLTNERILGGCDAVFSTGNLTPDLAGSIWVHKDEAMPAINSRRLLTFVLPCPFWEFASFSLCISLFFSEKEKIGADGTEH